MTSPGLCPQKAGQESTGFDLQAVRAEGSPNNKEQLELEWVSGTGGNTVRTLEKQEKGTAIHLCDIQQILIEHPLECLMICKDWVGQPVKLHRPKEPDPV